LGWFPLSGGMSVFAAFGSPLDRLGDLLRHAVLPVITLALARLGEFYLLARGNMITVLLGAFWGPSLYNIILALAVFSWSIPARTVRSQILAIKQEKYIAAARSYGADFFHLTLRHFGPGIFTLAAVGMIKVTGRAIVAEAGLSFLGLGDPTSRSWGLILNHALNFKGIYFTEYWKWWITAPLLAITILVAAIAILARDGERLANTKV
jgi:peptide/nickel transport system permease protein